MLLIITDSDDPSVDLLEPELKTDFIRINVDESDSWSFKYDNGRWSIHSPTKHHKISQETRCWWWKPLFSDISDEFFRNSEVEYIVREIYSETSRRGRTLGNPPYFHQLLGKMAILDAARSFLTTPATYCSFNMEDHEIEDAVVKSLSSAQVTDEKVMYTTRVDTSKLQFSGNPWLIQEYVSAVSDVTVQIVGSSIHAFERVRSKNTVDWRKEQLEDIDKFAWSLLPLTWEQERAIREFINNIQVDWGRIDMLRTSDGELVFLEFNANGQFAFLDLDDRCGLITSVASYLSSEEHPKTFVKTKEKENK